MILSVELGHWNYEIFDANDNKIPYAKWCDTETGEVEQIMMNSETGEFLKDDLGYVIFEKVKYPAPLRVLALGTDS